MDLLPFRYKSHFLGCLPKELVSDPIGLLYLIVLWFLTFQYYLFHFHYSI